MEIVLKQILDTAITLAKKAGDIQLQHFRKGGFAVESKSTETDIVTSVDKWSEEVIIKGIKEHYPNHAILSEESGCDKVSSDFEWVIDPLDGTTNYSAGLPVFSVSIGVKYRNETVVGVVYAPYINELFTAVKGCGAFLNGAKMQVSENTVLRKAVVGTGFPVDNMSTSDNNIDNFSRVLPKVRDVRRIGSAAMDICYVAAGVYGAFWEINLHEWDVCAAILIAEEAGAQSVRFREDRNVSVLVGAPAIKNAIEPLLSRLPG